MFARGLLVLALTALTAVSAAAETRRVALVVANHDGGEGLARLRYAERDAQRLVDVISDLGGFEGADILWMVDKESSDVMRQLDEVERRVEELKRSGDDVMFLFYYSGHAENGVLRLGQSRLDMRWLKRHLDQSAADVRLALIDSCGAGAITRTKGGNATKGATVAPAFVIAIENTLKTRGQAIIASSSADEASQESDEVQGSYFTHYLATGLRGDADEDVDGHVTLDEAYRYAYKRTVAATAGTRAGTQHPTYAFDLRGAGEVVITRPKSAEVVITFPEEIEGQFFVVDDERQLFVAELEKPAGRASKISLPAGRYVIKKRTDTHLLMARLNTREKGSFVVDEARMEKVAFADDYAKGSPILVSSRAEEPLEWSVAVGGGYQYMVDPAPGDYFPSMPMFTVSARIKRLLGPHLVSTFDFSYGAKQNHDVNPGGAALEVDYAQSVLGAGLLYELDFERFAVAAGPRLAFFTVGVDYNDGLPAESLPNLIPGAEVVVTWKPIPWLRFDGVARGNYLLYYVENRSVGFVEGYMTAGFIF
jgi:hypothetical protein